VGEELSHSHLVILEQKLRRHLEHPAVHGRQPPAAAVGFGNDRTRVLSVEWSKNGGRQGEKNALVQLCCGKKPG
jgi:hypothetical protein